MLNKVEKLEKENMWLQIWIIAILCTISFNNIKITNYINQKTDYVSNRLDTAIVSSNKNFNYFSDVDSTMILFSNVAAKRIIRSDSIQFRFMRMTYEKFKKLEKNMNINKIDLLENKNNK